MVVCCRREETIFKWMTGTGDAVESIEPCAPLLSPRKEQWDANPARFWQTSRKDHPIGWGAQRSHWSKN